MTLNATGPSAQAAHRVSRRYVWYVIGLLTTVNLVNLMDRMALSVMMPFIKADFHLTDAQLGLLVGFAFSLFYAVCGIPIALWGDRGVRKNLIALGLVIWSAMTVLSGVAQNFLHLLLARFGVGAGEAGSMPAAQSIICDYVPLQRRSSAFAILSLGLAAGTFAGMGLAGALAGSIGWRWTFAVLGIPGLLLAAIVKLTLREPKRGTHDPFVMDDTRMSLKATALFLWRGKSYRLLLLFQSVNCFIQYGLMQWWPSFYVRVYEVSASFAGTSLGIAIGVGSAAGLLTGGFLADRLAEKSAGLPLILGAAGAAVAMAILMGSLFAQTAGLSIFLVATAMFFWGVQQGPVSAALVSVVRAQTRAMAATVCTFFVSLVGFGLGPFAIGLLSDYLTPSRGPMGLRDSLFAMVCVLPVTILILLIAAGKLPEDLKMKRAGHLDAAGALR